MFGQDPMVEEYVNRKGWGVYKREHGKSGEHIILKVCPLCGSESKRAKRRFYINVETGLWDSHCCGKTGNMITLKKELGDLDFLREAPFTPGTSEGAKLAERINKLRRSRADRWEGFSIPPPSSAPLYHRRLMADEVDGALEYLTQDRRFTEETLRIFEIGVARRGYCNACKKQTSLKIDGDADLCPWCDGVVNNGREMIAIPYKVGGRVVNFKFRSIAGDKRFEKWDGAPTTLFNEDALEHPTILKVAICEAEFDAMTMAQIGFAVSIATGGAHKNFEDEWVARLALFDDVLLAYDADEAGNEGAEKASKQLGRYRCRRVKWPEKDANDCLRAGTSPDELRAIVEAASSYHVNAVKPYSEYIDELRRLRDSGKKVYGRQTMWRELNVMLAGLRDGEITVVTGDTGCGKTTWTTALAWDQARGYESRQGVGVLIASFEIPVIDVCRKLACMEANRAFRKPVQGDNDPKAMTDGDFELAVTKLSGMRIFFVDQYGKIPLEDLRDAIEYGVRRYGLWLVVIDHLHFFLDCDPRFERQMIDAAMRALKEWTLRLGIHMVIVVHPAKLRTDSSGATLPPDLNDLKGSSEIKKTADNVVRVDRKRGVDMPRDMFLFALIALLKVRSDFGYEGDFPLTFDNESMRYDNCTTDEKDRIAKAMAKKKKSGGKKKSQGEGDQDPQGTSQSKPKPKPTTGVLFDDEPKQIRIVQGEDVTVISQEEGDGHQP